MRYDMWQTFLNFQKICKPSYGKGNNHKDYWIAIWLAIYEDNILNTKFNLMCVFIEVLYSNDKLRYYKDRCHTNICNKITRPNNLLGI